MVPQPALVTSFTEFERAFGGLDDVGGLGDTHQLPGLRRPGVLRQRRPPAVRRAGVPVHPGRRRRDRRRGQLRLDAGRRPRPSATWRARWPGVAGNQISVRVGFQRSKNVLVRRQLRAAGVGSARAPPSSCSPTGPSCPRTPGARRSANVRIVARDAAGVSATATPPDGVDPVGRRRHRGGLPHHPPRDRRLGDRQPTSTPAWSSIRATRGRSPGCCRPGTRPTSSAWSGSIRQRGPRRRPPTLLGRAARRQTAADDVPHRRRRGAGPDARGHRRRGRRPRRREQGRDRAGRAGRDRGHRDRLLPGRRPRSPPRPSARPPPTT